MANVVQAKRPIIKIVLNSGRRLPQLLTPP